MDLFGDITLLPDNYFDDKLSSTSNYNRILCLRKCGAYPIYIRPNNEDYGFTICYESTIPEHTLTYLKYICDQFIASYYEEPGQKSICNAYTVEPQPGDTIKLITAISCRHVSIDEFMDFIVRCPLN